MTKKSSDYNLISYDLACKISDHLLKTNQEFSGQEANIYNEWCEAFEKKE